MDEETNVGFIDRLIRIAAGTALLWVFAAASGPSVWLLGLAPLLSGLLGFCPVYFYADWSTAAKAAQPRLLPSKV